VLNSNGWKPSYASVTKQRRTVLFAGPQFAEHPTQLVQAFMNLLTDVREAMTESPGKSIGTSPQFVLQSSFVQDQQSQKRHAFGVRSLTTSSQISLERLRSRTDRTRGATCFIRLLLGSASLSPIMKEDSYCPRP
jgi:hypothetical protein